EFGEWAAREDEGEDRRIASEVSVGEGPPLLIDELEGRYWVPGAYSPRLGGARGGVGAERAHVASGHHEVGGARGTGGHPQRETDAIAGREFVALARVLEGEGHHHGRHEVGHRLMGNRDGPAP